MRCVVKSTRSDRALHAGLIERGEIIDRLIAVKAKQGGGSAFRPDREAAMMRRLVERHRGILPLDTVEGIWRIIISTFTYVQAPYTVHADVSSGDARMRDSCRFTLRLYRAARDSFLASGGHRCRGSGQRRSRLAPRGVGGRTVVERARRRRCAEDHRAPAIR